VAGDDRIRLFCALQLPEDRRAELAAWAAAHVRAGRLVREADLHVTLAFLGSRPVGEVPAIAGELRAASAASHPLDLRPIRYRETRSVGMIVLEDADGGAGELADDLHGRLEALKAYRREARPWLPHATVVRFRERAGARPPLANMCSIHVVRSALYRSILGAGGARYDALETAALGGS
jgi:RNA 2',3'-cyclic 3'-phosphodiesterase